ncbi:MAG: zinc ABC transporter substrate-binding protein [Chloroflexota bacterium]|nr:zinc ABC transporter substrate-binding protein [Chloroflexota bacterium]
MRLGPIALTAMLMLALMVFAACDLNGEQDSVDAPPATSEPVLAEEPDPPSEEASTDVAATPRDPLSVVASIYPLGYFAERVGGDLVTVEVLVRPGFENHGFVPTASDLRSLEEADLVVMNGLELEPWMERALATLGENPDRIVVEAADASRAIEGVPHGRGHGEEGHEEDDDHGHEEDDDHGHEEDDDHGHEEDDDHAHEDDDDHGHEDDDDHGHEEDDDHAHEDDDDHGHEEDDDHAHEDDDDHGHEEDDHAHDHGELDPHMWLDPVLAVAQVERIRDALIGVDPDNTDTYRANASALADELGTLDIEIAEGLSSCRHDHFVTSHAAYGYLAARYGIEQLPVAGLSPETEPSPRELAEISDRIAELGLEHVMVEPVLSGELTSALAREHGIDLIAIHAIESVTQSELDDHGDYFGLMRDNLANLVLALDCA